MKRIVYFAAAAALLFAQAPVAGAQDYAGKVEVAAKDVTLSAGVVSLQMVLNVEDLKVKPNYSVSFTPALVSKADNKVIAEFDPIYVDGYLYARARERDLVLSRSAEDRQGAIYRKGCKMPKTLNYEGTVEYQDWMASSDLVLFENAVGCRNCQKGSGSSALEESALTLYEPVYVADANIPSVLPQGPQTTDPTSYLFLVNKSKISSKNPDSQGVINGMKDGFAAFSADPRYVVSSVLVTGYASPDGASSYNQQLSQKRADALAESLSDLVQEGSSVVMKTVALGEDWDGFREKIASSEISGKDKLMQVVEESYDEQNPDVCERKINRTLPYATRKALKADIYPQLRRADFAIEYTYRTYSDEELLKVAATSAEYLSEDQLYRAAYLSLEDGNAQQAINLLEGKAASAESFNLLGVANFRVEKFDAAKAMFDKAVSLGSENAAKNLAELETYMAQF